MFDRVGLLINGSPGRWSDYPLFSQPMTSIFCRELLYVRLRKQHIDRLPLEKQENRKIFDINIRADEDSG